MLYTHKELKGIQCKEDIYGKLLASSCSYEKVHHTRTSMHIHTCTHVHVCMSYLHARMHAHIMHMHTHLDVPSVHLLLHRYTTDMCIYMYVHVPPQVFKFLVCVLSGLVPAELWGSPENRTCFFNHILCWCTHTVGAWWGWGVYSSIALTFQ